MKEYIKVFAPATVANVACGFDILGLAINEPGDEVSIRIKDGAPGIEIVNIHNDGGKLPYDPDLNTVTVAIKSFLRSHKFDFSLEVELFKKMPFGSGLGSSAASAAAGVFAAKELLLPHLDNKELIIHAMKAEEIACGSGHADNVAPSILGGLVLIRSYDPLDIIKIDTPEDLYVTILYPEIDIPTKESRTLLSKQIPLRQAIAQWGNVAGLITGFLTEDWELIGRSLEDHVAEPARSILIPGFHQAKSMAIQNGALGLSISGSGPSLFALSRGESTAITVKTALSKLYTHLGIGHQTFVSSVNKLGPQIIDLE
jgi:homoserine kinase